MDSFSGFPALAWLADADLDFYDGLSDEVKAGLDERADEIHCAADLHRLAELLGEKQ